MFKDCVTYHEQAQEWVENVLYPYLISNGVKCKVEFYSNYYTYFKYSKYATTSIKLLDTKYKNTSIEIHAYLDLPGHVGRFCLWKYNGNHDFYSEDVDIDFIPLDSDLLDTIREFFGLHGIEQLTLF